MWGDAAYSGRRDLIRHHTPDAKNFIHTPLASAMEQGPMGSEPNEIEVSRQAVHVYFGIKRTFG